VVVMRFCVSVSFDYCTL